MHAPWALALQGLLCTGSGNGIALVALCQKEKHISFHGYGDSELLQM